MIRVYQKGCKGDLYIDYQKIIMDCSEPISHSNKKDANEINTILIQSEEKKLIEKCVMELLQLKLSNSEHFTHSGIINRIVYSDSTLIIRDYPSIEWKSFIKLTQRIAEK